MSNIIGNYLKLPASSKFGIGGACAALCYVCASTNPITLIAVAALSFLPDVVNRCLGKNRWTMVLLQPQQQVSDTIVGPGRQEASRSLFRPLHSKASTISGVLSSRDARNLFELSKELYAGIKANLKEDLRDYYFGNDFSASTTLLQGSSKPKEIVVYDDSEKASDLLAAAERTGETLINFRAFIQMLDHEVRQHIPQYTGDLIWSMKLYPQRDNDTTKFHGQEWHQDARGIPIDMFLYYYRDCCDEPTLAVSSDLRSPPQSYDEINPPNNSFVRFKNESHIHKGMTTQKDGNKLLITFWRLNKPIAS